MGRVYLARDLGLDRLVAVKFLRNVVVPDGDEAARFALEARAIARLRHPNIVQIHAVGEHDGMPYFAMEYLEGGSLRSGDGLARPPRQAAGLARSIASAVEEAHRSGIVHRDLKPANILLAADGTPKVADFGLAKAIGTDSGLTGTGSVMGSPSYMAPEQAEGNARDVGPPADVYSLGAILYELLTGRPPFRGTNVLETLAQVKGSEPVPPTRLTPGLPRDLETIALKCLEKSPAWRYASAADLAADLGRWINGEPIAARPSPFWERAWKLARRRPWQAALVVLGQVFLAAVLGTWIYSYARIGEALEVARVARLKAEAAKLESDRLAGSEAAARAESTRRSAGLALDKGVLLAESGRVGRGLLWMGRAYESAAGLDEPSRRAARASLADWDRRSTRPRLVADLGFPAYNLDLRGGLGLAALGGSGRPAVLDLATLAQPAPFPVSMEWKVKAVLNGDGRRLAAAAGSRARAWEVPSGRPIGEFPAQEPAAHPDALAIDPAGRRVALVDYLDGRLWLWEPGGAKPEVRPASPLARYREASFSPDGRLVAAVADARVARVWDAGTMALVREFPPATTCRGSSSSPGAPAWSSGPTGPARSPSGTSTPPARASSGPSARRSRAGPSAATAGPS